MKGISVFLFSRKTSSKFWVLVVIFNSICPNRYTVSIRYYPSRFACNLLETYREEIKKSIEAIRNNSLINIWVSMLLL